MAMRKGEQKMKKLDILIGALLVIGGLNWGLVGLFDYNFIETMFGELSMITRMIYGLVGLAAIYDILMIKAIWKRWDLHFRRPTTA